MLVSASAIGYYGAHGEEPLDEDAPPGEDFLPSSASPGRPQAQAAQELGMRAVQVRIGVVLDPRGGALAKMLPPFRLGLGGPVAGGHQYVSWIHRDDLVGIVLAAIEDERWSGRSTRRRPSRSPTASSHMRSGRALHRPALLPVPELALRALYGEMAQIVTTGARVLPASRCARLPLPPPPPRRGAGGGAGASPQRLSWLASKRAVEGPADPLSRTRSTP